MINSQLFQELEWKSWNRFHLKNFERQREGFKARSVSSILLLVQRPKGHIRRVEKVKDEGHFQMFAQTLKIVKTHWEERRKKETAVKLNFCKKKKKKNEGEFNRILNTYAKKRLILDRFIIPFFYKKKKKNLYFSNYKRDQKHNEFFSAGYIDTGRKFLLSYRRMGLESLAQFSWFPLFICIFLSSQNITRPFFLLFLLILKYQINQFFLGNLAILRSKIFKWQFW